MTSELQCPAGRSDVVIKTQKVVYIFELKMDNDSKDLDKIYKEKKGKVPFEYKIENKQV